MRFVGMGVPKVMGGEQNLRLTLPLPYFRVLITLPPSVPLPRHQSPCRHQCVCGTLTQGCQCLLGAWL